LNRFYVEIINNFSIEQDFKKFVEGLPNNLSLEVKKKYFNLKYLILIFAAFHYNE